MEYHSPVKVPQKKSTTVGCKMIVRIISLHVGCLRAGGAYFLTLKMKKFKYIQSGITQCSYLISEYVEYPQFTNSKGSILALTNQKT